MKKGLIITTGVIVILLLIGLVGSVYYGNQLEQDIVEVLDEVDQGEMDTAFTYEKVNVNPIFSRISINNIEIVDDIDGLVMDIGELEMNIPYQQARKIINEEKIERIDKAAFTLKNIKVYDKEMEMSFGRLSVSFNGNLDILKLEEDPASFLRDKQKLKFRLGNFDLNIKNTPELSMIKQYLTIEDFQGPLISNVVFELELDPDENTISINQYKIDNSILNTEMDAVYNFEKDFFAEKIYEYIKFFEQNADTYDYTEFETELVDFLPLKVTANAVFDLDLTGFVVGDINETGKYSLGSISGDSRSSVERDPGDINKYVYNDSVFEFTMKNLKCEFAGNIKDQVRASTGLDVSRFLIEEFAVNGSMEREIFNLTSNMNTNYFDMDIIIDIEEESSEFFGDAARFNKCKLTVSNINPELDKLLDMYQLMMGIPFIREDDSIVLEFTGSVNSPQIKVSEEMSI